jgi:KaiC/GvpD/RAD55 family RecA-like ATPase
MDRSDFPRKLSPPLEAAEATSCISDLCRRTWQFLSDKTLTPITRDLLKSRGFDHDNVDFLPARPTEYAFIPENEFPEYPNFFLAIPSFFRAFVEHQFQRLKLVVGASSFPLFGDERKYVLLHRDLLDPLRTCLRVFESIGESHDIQFFVMRATRRHHRISLTGETNRYFNVLAEALTAILNTPRVEEPGNREYDISELCDGLRESAIGASLPVSLYDPSLFLECCRAANYFSLGRSGGMIWFYAKVADGEFLLSRLFGFPSGIPGFDKLFSSGGILLVDDLVPRGAADEALPGRVLLVTGRSGTGKSILALQMAAEVARKGGIAWYMALEQTFAECVYALESMGISLSDDRFRVARSAIEAEHVFARIEGNKGGLVFLRHSSQEYKEFIDLLAFAAERMTAYDLRLLVVDPINAIIRPEADFSGQLRSVAVEALRRVREVQVNVWINGEQDFEGENEFFEHKIADTVLHLNLDDERGGKQRYIEVRKSRLQREIRGSHPYQIVPEHGIRVHVAPHAWTSALRGRTIRPADRFTTFGVPGIDGMLGPDNLSVFDLVVLEGPTGSLKTIAGLMFLRESSRKKESSSRALARSLLVTDRSSGSIDSLLKQIEVTGCKHIDVLPIETGDIEPGEVLGRIDDQFEGVRRNTYFYDRVMIDNLSRWEVSCPQLRNNDEFGVALLEYFRRHSVTTLFTCGRFGEAEEASLLQRAVIDGADCVIKYYLYELQGRLTPFLRVRKSRTGRHRTDLVEVRLKSSGIEVSNSPIPFRPGPSGTLVPINVLLILNSESAANDRYNQLIANQVRSTISRKAEVLARAHYSRGLVPELPEAADIEEVQVLQLDEHETRIATEPWLYAFATGRDIEEMLPRVRAKLQQSRPGIVPYYLNASLLMYDRSRLDYCNSQFASWTQVARCSADWESQASENIFLDCVLPNDETYNCCFLELLFDGHIDEARRSSPNWLDCGQKSVRAALEEFWQLFHRSHQWRMNSSSEENAFVPQARLWRHWYTTVAAMLPKVEPDRRHNLRIRESVGNLSIAGDWYIGVPIRSELPELGARIARSMVTHDEELRRFRMGVGLPTFTRFYEAGNRDSAAAIGAFSSLKINDLYSMLDAAVERSRLPNYSHFRGSLSYYLQRILEIPETFGHELLRDELQLASDNLLDEFNRLRELRRH